MLIYSHLLIKTKQVAIFFLEVRLFMCAFEEFRARGYMMDEWSYPI